MRSALIHRARVIGQRRGATRNAQGAYEQEPFTGPWIPARLMERGGVAAKARRGQEAVEARVDRGYELLLDFEDETGATVDRPTASSVFETDCPVLGSPTVELNGEPELLNNGADMIGYCCYGDVPKDRA